MEMATFAAAVASLKVSATLGEATGPSEGRLWEYMGVNSCCYSIFWRNTSFFLCKQMLKLPATCGHLTFASLNLPCNIFPAPGKEGCVISLPSCPLNTARSLILPCPQRCKPQQLFLSWLPAGTWNTTRLETYSWKCKEGPKWYSW